MAGYLYLLGPAVLLFLSLPLALLAILTTSLAFVTLLVRVAQVYLELALALLTSSLSGDPNSRTTTISKSTGADTDNTTQAAQIRRLIPREAAMSVMSPFHEAVSVGRLQRVTPTTATGIASLVGDSGPTRDFEGVGGWRLVGDGQDDASWTSMNSRLQLPISTSAQQRQHSRGHKRQHRRSHSAQTSIAPSPEAFRMSPVASRKGTPPGMLRGGDMESPEGYFAVPVGSPVVVGDMSPEEASSKMRMDQRRLSIGSSGASSVVDIRTPVNGAAKIPGPET